MGRRHSRPRDGARRGGRPPSFRERGRRIGDTRACGGLGAARQRLAALAVRGIRNDPPERYRRLLEEAAADKERAERALAEHSARFRDDQSRTRVLFLKCRRHCQPEARWWVL